MKFFCSNCGIPNNLVNGSKPKFCGGCGTPMDGSAFLPKQGNTSHASTAPAPVSSPQFVPKFRFENEQEKAPPARTVRRAMPIQKEEEYDETEDFLDTEFSPECLKASIEIETGGQATLGELMKTGKTGFGGERRTIKGRKKPNKKAILQSFKDEVASSRNRSQDIE